jgi:hypothetical protein
MPTSRGHECWAWNRARLRSRGPPAFYWSRIFFIDFTAGGEKFERYYSGSKNFRRFYHWRQKNFVFVCMLSIKGPFWGRKPPYIWTTGGTAQMTYDKSGVSLKPKVYVIERPSIKIKFPYVFTEHNSGWALYQWINDHFCEKNTHSLLIQTDQKFPNQIKSRFDEFGYALINSVSEQP